MSKFTYGLIILEDYNYLKKYYIDACKNELNYNLINNEFNVKSKNDLNNNLIDIILKIFCLKN